MSAPNLDTNEARDAYRAELRAIARGPRLLGFIIVIAGAGILITSKSAETPAPWLLNLGWLVLGAGWLILLYAMIQRTLYHRRRMRGADTQD